MERCSSLFTSIWRLPHSYVVYDIYTMYQDYRSQLTHWLYMLNTFVHSCKSLYQDGFSSMQLFHSMVAASLRYQHTDLCTANVDTSLIHMLHQILTTRQIPINLKPSFTSQVFTIMNVYVQVYVTMCSNLADSQLPGNNRRIPYILISKLVTFVYLYGNKTCQHT